MHVLVFRFSSLGDVALLMPVLRALLDQNSSLQVTLVTRTSFAPLFKNIPRLKVIGIDFKNDIKGFLGLYRLYKSLKKQSHYDYLIDVHKNIRTSILKFFFKLEGLKSVSIDKGKRKKKIVTRRKNKVFVSLTHTIDRYLYTFERVGLSATIGDPPYFSSSFQEQENINSFLRKLGIIQQKPICIGIAPFAGFETKMWGLNKVQDLVEEINKELKAHIFLFGGGDKEVGKLKLLQQINPEKITVVAGQFTLEEEIALLPNLDIMVSMDSSNMHLAALAGIRVVSIWGATHYSLGFAPYKQSTQNIIEIPLEKLTCRPCSVYGGKPCFRKDIACMQRISVDQVFNHIKKIINDS